MRLGIEFIARAHAERVGFLFKADRVLAAEIENARGCVSDLAQRRDDDARQAVFALETRHVTLEDGNVDDQPARSVRHDLSPVFDAWRIDRRLHDAKVLGGFRIRRDDEMFAVVLDRILMTFVARHDETRRRLRLVGVNQMRFARLVIVDIDDDEFFATAWS